MIQWAIYGYVILQIIIGIVSSKNMNNDEDFILAGRTLGLGMATLTIFATWFGAEAVVGTAGAVYEDGLSAAGADPFGYAVALGIMGFFFAKRLRARGFVTLGDLFSKEFGPQVERLAILLIIPGPIIWGGAQIAAFGKVVSDVSQISPTTAILIAAIAVVLYTMIGGLRASAITDMIQGIIMILGLIILSGMMFYHTMQQQITIEVQRLELWSHSTPWFEHVETWSIPIFGTLVAVELISRILACKDPQTSARASILGGGLYLLVGLLPVFIGLVAPSLISKQPADAEALIPFLAKDYLYFPDFIVPHFAYILFVGALISAILSTVDSVLLAGASMISHHIGQHVPALATDRGKLLAVRGCVLVLGVISYILAINANRIKDLVELASSFGSSGLFPVVCFGLFSKIGGAYSAIAALVSGLLLWLLGTALQFHMPYMTSVLGAGIVYWVVALIYDEKRVEKLSLLN